MIIRPAFVSNINRESPRFPIPHFPALPCSQTPPMSPAASPLTAAYCCLPDTRPCRPSVLDFTGLNRFTCVTAGRSLPLRLRLADGVTAYQPKGRFPVGGWPLPGQEFHLPEASSFRLAPLVYIQATAPLQDRFHYGVRELPYFNHGLRPFAKLITFKRHTVYTGQADGPSTQSLDTRYQLLVQ